MTREQRLQAADAEMIVDADTGRIARMRLRGTDILRVGPRFGCFPMAPWCGRMRDGRLRWADRTYQLPRTAEPHAIHGTVRDRPWEVVHHTDTRLVLAQDLVEPWPFPGRVTHSIELAGDTAVFAMTVEAFAEPFPAQVGWHPWFLRRPAPDDADLELAFTPAWQEERGPDGIPDGERVAPTAGPWDDCFGAPDGVHAVLTWPRRWELTLSSPATWAVVYDQPPATICVEPQTGPPDGLNSLPHPVTPDAPLTSEMRWRWRALDSGTDPAAVDSPLS